MKTKVFWKSVKNQKLQRILLEDMALDHLKSTYKLLLVNKILLERKVDALTLMLEGEYLKNRLWQDKSIEWFDTWLERFINEFDRRDIKKPAYKADLDWAIAYVREKNRKKHFSRKNWNSFKKSLEIK